MPTPTQELRAVQKNRGRNAKAPQDIPLRGWKDVAYRIFVGFNQNRILLTAAGVTFYLLLALVPSLTLLVVAYGLLNDARSVIEQVNLLEGIVPDGGLGIIRDQLIRLTIEDNRSLSITLLVSLGVALWGAGAGIKALFEAMNVVYGETEKRNFLVINLIALVFVLGGLIMMMLMLTVVLVLPVLFSMFSLGVYDWAVQVGAYFVMLLCLGLVLSAVYRWGPSREAARWRWVTPGSILATLCILIMSAGYSWYAANFSNYSAAYGSLGAVIGFLTWMWLSVTIVILGGSLNSEIEHQTVVDSTTGRPEPIGTRGAYVADTVGGRWPARGGEAAEGRPASEEAVKR